MQKQGYSRSHMEGRKATDRTALCMLHYRDECRYHLIFSGPRHYVYLDDHEDKALHLISRIALWRCFFYYSQFSQSPSGVVSRSHFHSDSLGRIKHTAPTEVDINLRGRSHISHTINFVSSLQFCARPLGILSKDFQTLRILIICR